MGLQEDTMSCLGDKRLLLFLHFPRNKKALLSRRKGTKTTRRRSCDAESPNLGAISQPRLVVKHHINQP